MHHITIPAKGYIWVDNSPVEYTKWAPGSPDRDNPKKCIQMHVQMWQGLWADDNCEEGKFFVCKAYKGSSPRVIDICIHIN